MEHAAFYTALNLNARLLPDIMEGFLPDPLEPWSNRESKVGKARDCADVPLNQPFSLIPRDSCHKRQVIIQPPLRIAID
jgi:hypothetical protein